MIEALGSAHSAPLTPRALAPLARALSPRTARRADPGGGRSPACNSARCWALCGGGSVFAMNGVGYLRGRRSARADYPVVQGAYISGQGARLRSTVRAHPLLRTDLLQTTGSRSAGCEPI